MVRAAVIEDSKVANVVEADILFAQARGWVVSDTARVGDIYDERTGAFSSPPAPPPPVPRAVTNRQGYEVMIRRGIVDDVEAAIDAIADPTERRIMRNYLDRAQEYEFSHAGMRKIAFDALGMTEEDLADLFREAATL